MKLSALFLSCAVFWAGCASEEKAPRVHKAVLMSQDYFVDNGMPVREVKKQEPFFFKKCDVDNTGPWPTKTTYDCNEL